MSYLYFFVFCCFGFGQIDTLVTVDASNYNDWIYFSFSSASTVEVENPESSLDWDVAFQRKHIRTNSGLSGLGDGGALVDSSMTWIDQWNNAENSIESDDWVVDQVLNDFYDPVTHLFGEGIKNPALNSWGWFDEQYALNVNHYVMYVLTADGQSMVKFWPYSYYSANGAGGNISFRFAVDLNSNSCSSSIGDVNEDGILNVVDIVSIVSYIMAEVDYNECQLSLSDYNFDGIVNVVDVVAIVNMILN
jgi:hypothetical protein